MLMVSVAICALAYIVGIIKLLASSGSRATSDRAVHRALSFLLANIIIVGPNAVYEAQMTSKMSAMADTRPFAVVATMLFLLGGLVNSCVYVVMRRRALLDVTAAHAHMPRTAADGPMVSFNVCFGGEEVCAGSTLASGSTCSIAACAAAGDTSFGELVGELICAPNGNVCEAPRT